MAAQSPAKIVLFGSRARGDERPDSDLDLLVIEREVESRWDERLRLRKELSGLGVPIDLIVVSAKQAEQWEHVPGTVLHQALREGKVLAEPGSA